ILQCDPEVSLVGARVNLFPRKAIRNGYKEYERWQNSLLSHSEMVAQRFVESPLAHPSVMFRREAIVELGGYRQGDFPEDYELWLRAIDHGITLTKDSSILIDWRESHGRLSRTHPAYHRQAFDQLRASFLATLPALRLRPVAFWGAGRKTRQRANHLIDLGINPWVWIDIDPKKIGNQINGVPVRAPDYLNQLVGGSKPFVLIYVTNHGARELIDAELTGMGHRINKDFLAVG
ncbi:MAG: glycosyl transferase, partial [bacterium]